MRDALQTYKLQMKEEKHLSESLRMSISHLKPENNPSGLKTPPSSPMTSAENDRSRDGASGSSTSPTPVRERRPSNFKYSLKINEDDDSSSGSNSAGPNFDENDNDSDSSDSSNSDSSDIALLKTISVIRKGIRHEVDHLQTFLERSVVKGSPDPVNRVIGQVRLIYSV